MLTELGVQNALLRLPNQVRSIRKFEQVGMPAIKEIGSLWVALNTAASIESLFFNVTGNDAISQSGRQQQGNRYQWTKMGFSLFRSAKYQKHLVRNFRDAADRRNVGAFGKSLVHFTRLGGAFSKIYSSVNNSIERGIWRGKLQQKRNGLPEFTPHTIDNITLFLSDGGVPGEDTEGLTGIEKTDFVKAEASNFRKSSGTWHHHEVMGIMQLVPSELNNFIGSNASGVKHWGGVAFWKLMKNRDYK